MTLEKLPSDLNHEPTAPFSLHQHRSLSHSSTNSDDWVSPYTLPPLPVLPRNRGQSENYRSPELPHQRVESGSYYAAAWGSPYATPSPRAAQPISTLPKRNADFEFSSPPLPLSRPELGRNSTDHPRRKPLSERPNWLSDSDESQPDTSVAQEQTPRGLVKTTSWGPSPISSSRPRHRISESLATITPEGFHESTNTTLESGSPHSLTSKRVADLKMVSTEKPLPPLDRRSSLVEPESNSFELSTSPTRPRPSSLQSYQRQKRKVAWNGKNCIISLPPIDRLGAGLPPLLTPQQVQERIDKFVAAGYRLEGFELTGGIVSSENSGQSRPIFPADVDTYSDVKKSRRYEVRIPNQAEWEAWVNLLKEEKLRALGVSPSNSEAPPSTQSPFSPNISRVSSGYPGLVPSPPIAPSSSASNPMRLTGTAISPSLISSSGLSPQPGSAKSAQFNGLPKSLHGYKQSMAPPSNRGRTSSPYDHVMSHSVSLGPGMPPIIQPLSSRQNSFSPGHPLHLPNMGEILSPIQQQHVFDLRGQGPSLPAAQVHHTHMPSQAHFSHLSNTFRNLPSPQNAPRHDHLPKTPTHIGPSRSPIEIAHPTPKSHRHNLSMALQKEIDEAEAAAREQDSDRDVKETEVLADSRSPALRRDSAWEGSVNDEPPILRRPETITDERSEIETNPSIAATPMLMDDKNPFSNWQTLSDAAKGDPQPDDKPSSAAPRTATKLNVQAKEFDPRGAFSSANFADSGISSAPFGLQPAVQPFAAKPPRLPGKNKLSISHLNAGAPTFTPGNLKSPQNPPIPEDEAPVTSKSAPFEFTAATQSTQATSFGFSAAQFNVAAPVFNPSNSPTTNFKTMVGHDKEPPANSIFGPVVIDPNSAATRRASKAIPITQPRIEPMTDEDVDGRPMASIERQKRARRTDNDGNESPLYADSAPFRHSTSPPRSVEGKEAKSSQPSQADETFDGWSYISANEEELKPTDQPVSRSHSRSPSVTVTMPFSFKNEVDAATFNQALPPLDDSLLVGKDEDVKDPVDNSHVEKSHVDQAPEAIVSPQQPKSSLSALATPFEIKPRTVDQTPTKLHTARKPKGLEASRFAIPQSPVQSSAGPSTSLSSPPAELYYYEQKTEPEEAEAEGQHDTPTPPEEALESVPKDDDTKSGSEAPAADDRLLDIETSPRPPVEYARPQNEDVEEIDGPSFEEIDAVMKRFEEDPELGIERLDTPLQSTPFINEPLVGTLRSSAPSPSPPVSHDVRDRQEESKFLPSTGLGIGIHNLNAGRGDISDWGGVLPRDEEDKLEIRSRFFDGHVNDLVGGILENRIGPLERTLETMQQSLAVIAGGLKTKPEMRGFSTDGKESDADDEDEYDAFEGFSQYRARSPAARRDVVRQDRIRAAVSEALASFRPPTPPPPTMDLAEFNDILQEIRQVALQTNSLNTQHELRTIVEDVISNHPRLRGTRVQKDHEAAEIRLQPKIDGLESMLAVAKEHASEEVRLRRRAEEEMGELKIRLRIAEQEAAQYRESSKEAEQTLLAFVEEKKSYKSLEEQHENFLLKNAALETTLEEYRMSSDQWREDIREERSKNSALREILQGLHGQLEDQSQLRQTFRQKVERLQEDLTRVVQDSQSDQNDWRAREHKLLSKLALVEDTLAQERQHRAKAENELSMVESELKASVDFKSAFENATIDIARLNETMASLREENRALDTKCFSLDRELDHTVKTRDAEVATKTTQVQAELESVRGQLDSIRTDSEAQISRLQSRLDHAELDIEDQKAKHDALLSEMVENHKETVREMNEKRESALEEQHKLHEKKLNDLRERHTRELHNSFDNRTRLEHQLNERLALGQDKNKHLESKIADLEERLEAARAAVRAAAEAAIAKGINLPTPAPSVVASPPQRAASGSISFVKNTDVPERISPQALRESIMVLQDQLQNRELKIETLENELASVDKDAARKIKERETEIGWLRELLGVRVDDLEVIISTLSQPDFDRESIKDATIRLKANLQMEQQLKERAQGSSLGSLPSIATLTSYAQSPRALPMAAVAAFSNWRKVRDSSIGTISDLATGVTNQTPSRSTIGSPSSILSGIMTPPSTSQRQSSSSERTAPPPAMRPLAGVAGQTRKSSIEARPLRAYNAQARTLSSRQQETRGEAAGSYPLPRADSPQTPTQNKGPSLDFGEDVDEDASPLDGRHSAHLEEGNPICE
ncbi:hypothetical protein PV10_07986 [Exophiala mesophila]|uniref:Uncharacterized protein n=1 Tax=Exophiala mesophila TaxID=212818 RepID=A0A0D1Z0C5_EXOME|nr:uncharacterized protein PV10_07986 [Exophiala mesophila]KIV88292.1 hypothetical protein PV10_07986 [Exophiala mesophila]